MHSDWFDYRLFENFDDDFFDDEDIEDVGSSNDIQQNDEIDSYNNNTVADGFDGRFIWCINMYSCGTSLKEELQREWPGNDMYRTVRVVNNVFDNLSFVDSYQIVTDLAPRKNAKELDRYHINLDREHRFCCQFYDMKEDERIAFNFYVIVYFNVQKDCGFREFYNDIIRMIRNFQAPVKLRITDEFILAPNDSDVEYKFGLANKLPEQYISVYNTLFKKNIDTDNSSERLIIINLKKLKIDRWLKSYEDNSELDIKSIDYVIYPANDEYNNRVYLPVIYIDIVYDYSGNILTHNKVLKDLCDHFMIFNDDIMYQYCRYFNICLRLFANDGVQMKRFPKPYAYVSDINAWKWVRNKYAKQDVSKIYFHQQFGTMYGRWWKVFAMFPDKKWKLQKSEIGFNDEYRWLKMFNEDEDIMKLREYINACKSGGVHYLPDYFKNQEKSS